MTAEIVPFPLRATQSWRFIAAEYARRRDKAGYARKVIAGNIERLQGFGVSQERIDREIANLEWLFQRLGNAQEEKARA
jgi:hypothetical protein